MGAALKGLPHHKHEDQHHTNDQYRHQGSDNPGFDTRLCCTGIAVHHRRCVVGRDGGGDQMWARTWHNDASLLGGGGGHRRGRWDRREEADWRLRSGWLRSRYDRLCRRCGDVRAAAHEGGELVCQRRRRMHRHGDKWRVEVWLLLDRRKNNTCCYVCGVPPSPHICLPQGRAVPHVTPEAPPQWAALPAQFHLCGCPPQAATQTPRQRLGDHSVPPLPPRS